MEIAQIHQKIYEIKGQKVMLDFDLAELYQVQTKVLNQAVKRNLKRFPSDFMFQLTENEYLSLMSQIVTSKLNAENQGWGGRKTAFRSGWCRDARPCVSTPPAVELPISTSP